MANADQVRRQFSAAAGRYASGTIMPDDRERVAEMRRLLQPALGPQARVLDIATGAGHTALALAPHARRVVGIDLTPAMLAAARQNATAAGVDLEWLHMDACRLDFADGDFDVVTCRYAPHHFADLPQAVGEMRRVLRVGGRLYSYDNSAPEGQEAVAFVDRIERLRDPSHGHSAPRSEWLALLDAHGFDVLHTRGVTGAYALDAWFARAGTAPDRQREVKRLLDELPESLADAIRVTRADDKITGVTIRDLHLEILAVAR